LPHFWLPDGRSLYDALGPEFTLIRRDPAVEVDAIFAAAKARGVPVELLDVPPGASPQAYRHALVLSRPDRHICWRGDAVPDDPGAVIDRITGHAAMPMATG
ncbi:MAG TPA: hypothetical protein VF442_04105, partial [Sphingobium sp.]